MLERVLEMSPRDSDTSWHLSLPFLFLRDFRRAEEYADLTISLAPDRVDGYFRKQEVFYWQGRWRDARAVFEKLPTSFPTTEYMRFNLEFAERRYEEALAMLNAIPEAVFKQVFGERAAGLRAMFECECHSKLGDERGVQETCGRARQILEKKTHEYPDNYWFHASLGRTYAYLGCKDDAICQGERAVALMPVSKDAILGTKFVQRLATINALVGEPEAAIEQIEYLLSIPSRLTVGGLRAHPYWDPLRDHPRFQALLEKYDTDTD